MGEITLLKIFISLGIPGLALGIFYLLFRQFHWDFPKVPQNYVGPIIILFMILTFALVFYALSKFDDKVNYNTVTIDNQLELSCEFKDITNDGGGSEQYNINDFEQRKNTGAIIEVTAKQKSNSFDPSKDIESFWVEMYGKKLNMFSIDAFLTEIEEHYILDINSSLINKFTRKDSYKFTSNGKTDLIFILFNQKLNRSTSFNIDIAVKYYEGQELRVERIKYKYTKNSDL